MTGTKDVLTQMLAWVDECATEDEDLAERPALETVAQAKQLLKDTAALLDLPRGWVSSGVNHDLHLIWHNPTDRSYLITAIVGPYSCTYIQKGKDKDSSTAEVGVPKAERLAELLQQVVLNSSTASG